MPIYGYIFAYKMDHKLKSSWNNNSQYILDFSAWQFLTSSIDWLLQSFISLFSAMFSNCTASFVYHSFCLSILIHTSTILGPWFPLASLASGDSFYIVTGLVLQTSFFTKDGADRLPCQFLLEVLSVSVSDSRTQLPISCIIGLILSPCTWKAT